MSEDRSLAIGTYLSWAMNLSEADGDHAAMLALDAIGSNLHYRLDAVMARCESPAERLFLLGFALTSSWVRSVKGEEYRISGVVDESATRSESDECGPTREGISNDEMIGSEILVMPQFPVDFLGRTLHADFLVSSPQLGVAVVVEIDGHEWHEKTKEQASADRERDRFLVRNSGRPVIRFTGSDVYREPTKCVKETLLALDGLLSARLWSGNSDFDRGYQLGRSIGFESGFIKRGTALVLLERDHESLNLLTLPEAEEK